MQDRDDLQCVSGLFDAVRSLDRSSRSDFIDKHCQGNSKLKKQLLELLAHHDSTGLLDDPIHVDLIPAENIPSRIADFEVMERLGFGGMGVVYKATQSSPQRTVAIKVLSAQLLTSAALERFSFESHVLARLNHQNIASIYQSGVWDDGGQQRPYFVMEFIDGVPLNRYVERSKPQLNQLLSIFIDICSGVHHAHQNAIIHRDLKPSNILIDNNGTPKIVDFGVARSLDPSVPHADITATGQLLGTLAYMSPEQVGSRPDLVDTRTDVYALGVILYELLTGSLPYASDSGSIATAARQISEAEPQSLSKVTKRLGRDLQTITSKALNKDQSKRYQSAESLASDVERFLNHQPIEARPVTLRYQLTRFARRHRGLSAGILVSTLLLASGLTGFAYQAAQTSAEARTRREVYGFLRDMLTSIEPERAAGRPLTVREMLDDASSVLYLEFEDFPEVKCELLITVGSTYHKLGEYATAEQMLRHAHDIAQARLKGGSPTIFNAAAGLGLALRDLGRLDEAEAVLRDALEMETVASPESVYALRTNLVTVLNSQDQHTEAAALSRLIHQESLQTLGPNHLDSLMAQNNYASQLIELQQFSEAKTLLEDCLERYRSHFGDDHPSVLFVLANLGNTYTGLGNFELGEQTLTEAFQRSERVLGPTHLRTLSRKNHLVRFLLITGEPQRAADTALQLLDSYNGLLLPNHPDYLSATELAVTALAFQGDTDLAVATAHKLYSDVSELESDSGRSSARAATLLKELYEELGDAENMILWETRARTAETP